ncbi:response regulator [Paraglaciecola aestuariivivens]
MLFEFSEFAINTQKKQLYFKSNLVNADQRVVDLVIALVSHYPKHCDKHYLLTHLWPETVVSEWSISKLVSDARQEFKKLGYQAEVIQTLHGRGYRLASHLGDKLTKVSDPTPLRSDNSPSKFSFLVSKIVLPLGLAFCLIGLAFISNLFKFSSPDIQKSQAPDSIGRLLWVDDNPDNNQVEKAYLESHKITVYQVKSTEEALTSLELYDFNVVISDMGRDDEVLAGLNLLKALRDKNDLTPFVMYTIVLTQAQQDILTQYQGQGVAVEANKLYQLVLPYFPQAQPDNSVTP